MKNVMRIAGSIVCCVVVASGMIGCSPKQPSPDKNQAASPANPAEKSITIAVVPKGLAHQFWLTVKAGAETAGKEVGAKIIWQGPAKETDVDREINIIEDMISQKVDAIVMAACDENALVQCVEKASQAKIPVVTIDSGVKSDLPVSFVATDNIAGAKAAAKELAKLIGNEGEVGVIPFVAGAATSEMRVQGFKDGLADYPNVKIVSTLYSQSDAAKAMNVTQDMMTSCANLKGIFATNEPGVVGAAQAIKTSGKAGAIKLVGFDASPEEIAALQEGVVQALIVQNPFQMGYKGVKAALDAMAGKPVEKRIDTGVTVITKENLNEPDIQKLLNPLN